MRIPSRIGRVLRALYPPNVAFVLKMVDREILFRQRRFLARHPLQPEEWGIACPWGMGDLYLACAFAEAVRARHGGSGLVAFVRPEFAYIPTLFPAVSRIVPVADVDSMGIQPENLLLAQGRLFVVFPHTSFLPVIGYKGVDFLDYLRLCLKLPLDTQPTPPRAQTADERASGQEILRRHGLHSGRTVVLAPDATSTGVAPDSFWAALAGELKRGGYDVAFNNPRHTRTPIESAVSLDVPVANFLAVAEEAGWVISARSGLCDLLAHASAKLTVVYPDESDNPRRQQLTSGFSLVRSGLRPDAEEVVFSHRSADEIIQRICGQEGAARQPRTK
jgi:hypothetical protein